MTNSRPKKRNFWRQKWRVVSLQNTTHIYATQAYCLEAKSIAIFGILYIVHGIQMNNNNIGKAGGERERERSYNLFHAVIFTEDVTRLQP